VNATKERQAWCCLQVKLCDPRLSALSVPWCKKVLYKYSSFPFPFLQSGYRQDHSTETAVLRVLSDILQAVDNGDLAALVLLNMSAAFDTVDHSILLRRLHLTFCIDDTAHGWFQLHAPFHFIHTAG